MISTPRNFGCTVANGCAVFVRYRLGVSVISYVVEGLVILVVNHFKIRNVIHCFYAFKHVHLVLDHVHILLAKTILIVFLRQHIQLLRPFFLMELRLRLAHVLDLRQLFIQCLWLWTSNHTWDWNLIVCLPCNKALVVTIIWFVIWLHLYLDLLALLLEVLQSNLILSSVLWVYILN